MWSPLENTLLVSGNQDFSVKIIDMNLHLQSDSDQPQQANAATADEVSGRVPTKKLSTSNSTVEPKLIFHKNPIMKAKFAPFAKTFTTCDKVENVLRLYSYQEDVEPYALQKFDSDGGKIVDFEWVSHQNRYQLLSLSSDKIIRSWSPPKDLLQMFKVKSDDDEDDLFGDVELGSVNKHQNAAPALGVSSSNMFSDTSNVSTVSLPTNVASQGDVVSFRSSTQDKRFNENSSVGPFKLI